VLTVKTVAEKLACSQATVYALIASGKLRHYRIGTGRGAIRVSEEQMAEFLSGAESGTAAAPARPVKLKHLQF
jgi:excisionase family DNA binding protein